MATLTSLTSNLNPNKSFEVDAFAAMSYFFVCFLILQILHIRCNVYIYMQVLPNPTDSLSSLSFSPKSNLLVATSWDNQVILFLL
jgi:mRNA export factor